MLERYSRQMILPQIGVEGQRVLATSKVLVIGTIVISSGPLDVFLFVFAWQALVALARRF